MGRGSSLKKIKIAGLLLVGVAAFAQAPAEPEFANVFYRLDAGKLIALERPNTAIKAKAGPPIILGVVHARSFIKFNGGKSPVRVPAAAELEFVVRAASFDPASLYNLRLLQSNKKQRTALLSTVHASIIGASMQTALSDTIPIEFSHYGSGSLLIKVANLQPGEYAIGQMYGPSVFCFGVD
jgi:hypothetical protein